MKSWLWQQRLLRIIGSFIVLFFLMVVALAHPVKVQAQNPYCFDETGYCISGRIREFWEQNGGLYVFGLPITSQYEDMIEGKPYQVQWFERHRLELHPENPRPYDVLLGRLGAIQVDLAIEAELWSPSPRQSPRPGCLYFEQTGLNVCGDILETFRANGLNIDGRSGYSHEENLALFGVPLTPLLRITIDDESFVAQWFERARLELHPENAPPYHVLPGLLGSELIELLTGSSSDTAGPGGITPATVASCSNIPDAVHARIRPQNCITPGTTLFVDLLGFSPGETIGFWVTAPDGRVSGSNRPLRIENESAVTDIPIDTTRLPLGLWSIVFEGTRSRHQSIVYFQVR